MPKPVKKKLSVVEKWTPPALGEIKVVRRLVKTLHTPDYNPRAITKSNRDALLQSLKDFGYVEPIVINKRTGNTVSGNTRAELLKDLRVKSVDVVEIDVSEEKEKALNLTLNNEHVRGHFVPDALEKVLADLAQTMTPIELEVLNLDFMHQESIMDGELGSDFEDKFASDETHDEEKTEKSLPVGGKATLMNKCPECGHTWKPKRSKV